ncbi:coiled-coil domain-containing protein [Streptomyces griseosporeus]|uniref:hypothetical protein n=1 Tax=Streptomyces griseosporeus TaxID=1910 RepID=UPI003700B872
MKPTAQRRHDRRALLDNLLGRALRGHLTTAEAALLAEQVREEQRGYDQTRRSLGETTAALTRHREAADTAIREAEDEAKRFKADYLNACQTIATMHAAATGYDDRGPVRGVVEDVADMRARMLAAEEALTNEQRERAEAAQLSHQYRNRAEQAEQRLARIRDMADAWERRLPASIRTATAAEAVRLAAIGDDRPVMFAITAEQAEAAAARSEQAAEQHRRALAEALGRSAGTSWPELIEHAAEAHQWATSAAVRADRRRAEEAEHRASRYRLAWLAARRDRKADRAAMAADLPDTLAGRATRLTAAQPTAAEASDRLRQWAAAGVSVAQLAAPARP